MSLSNTIHQFLPVLIVIVDQLIVIHRNLLPINFARLMIGPEHKCPGSKTKELVFRKPNPRLVYSRLRSIMLRGLNVLNYLVYISVITLTLINILNLYLLDVFKECI